MDLVVTQYLYEHFPNLINHSMREILRHINDTRNLATVAKTIGVDSLVATKLTVRRACVGYCCIILNSVSIFTC